MAGDGSEVDPLFSLLDSAARLVEVCCVARELFDDRAGDSRGRNVSVVSGILFVLLTWPVDC